MHIKQLIHELTEHLKHSPREEILRFISASDIMNTSTDAAMDALVRATENLEPHEFGAVEDLMVELFHRYYDLMDDEDSQAPETVIDSPYKVEFLRDHIEVDVRGFDDVETACSAAVSLDSLKLSDQALILRKDKETGKYKHICSYSEVWGSYENSLYDDDPDYQTVEDALAEACNF